MTHAYAHAHFSNERVIAKLSCPGGGVWVAVTREFERDNCVTSEILQSDWTIPNRAGVPRKSTKVPRPSFVRESREGLGPRPYGSEEVRQGQRLRNTHVTTRIPKPHTTRVLFMCVGMPGT